MFFSGPTKNQIIALAGMFQACEMVIKLAETGSCPGADFETAIHSLFEQNPASTEAVFGTIDNISSGMDILYKVLKSPKDQKNVDLLRYVLGVLHLQKKLQANKAILNKVGAGIDSASQQAEHFSETHANVIANLADLYQQTISTFRHRIQVQGKPQYLQQTDTASRIRCLLFAAIRAAMLWNQVGGKRRHLLFNREQILEGLIALRRKP